MVLNMKKTKGKAQLVGWQALENFESTTGRGQILPLNIYIDYNMNFFQKPTRT